MAIDKTVNLAPTTEETTTYKTSGSVSTRAFKILRQQVDDNKNTLQAQITVNADEIALKASKTYVDNSDLNLQSQITVNAGNINLKVSKNDVINQINVSTEGVQISASKLAISGYVQFTNLSTAGQTTINGGNIQTGTLSADKIYGGTINGNTVNVINLNASNIVAGSLSVDRLTVGTVSGWYFGSSDISRSGISLGSGNITLTGVGTSGPTINFNYGGGSTRFYNYAQNWIAAQNNFRVDSQFMSIGVASFLSDINCDGDVGGATGTFGYTITSFVRPSTDNLYDVGTATYRYDDVYATNGTIQTSDLNEKTAIADIEHGIDLILNVKPVQFQYINGESSRTHYGVIAQWLKDTMTNVGIDDAAMYIDPEEGTKGVRYTELIAPMIQTIQHLNERIKVLEDANQRTL